MDGTNRHIVVQPAIDNWVPAMEANTAGAPPLSVPKSKVEVVVVVVMYWLTTNMLPSRDTFDQGNYVLQHTKGVDVR